MAERTSEEERARKELADPDRPRHPEPARSAQAKRPRADRRGRGACAARRLRRRKRWRGGDHGGGDYRGAGRDDIRTGCRDAGARLGRGGHGPGCERDDRLPVLGGLRHPGSAEGLARRERGRGQRHVHRQPRRDPGQDQGGRWLLRRHHLLPGLQAALPGARDSLPDRHGEDPEPDRAVPVLPVGRRKLLDRPRRHAHRRAVDVGLDRPHLGRRHPPRRALLLERPARPEVQGQDRAARRSGRLVHARLARPRLRPVGRDRGTAPGHRRPAHADRPAGEEHRALVRRPDDAARLRATSSPAGRAGRR